MKHPEPVPQFQEVLGKEGSGEKILALIQDAELNKALSDIDEDYLYWEKFKYKVKKLPYDQELLWIYNRMNRNQSSVKIQLGNDADFKFRYTTTQKIQRYLHKFDLHIGGDLEGKSIIPSDDKHRFLISSIMEEAIASSQLEGAATTREIAKEMLRSNRKPRSLDERMILNNYRTIKKVLEIKDQPITKQLILELHAIISKDIMTKGNEGAFRQNNQVKVVDEVSGEIFYTPPDFVRIDQLMDHFCEFANNDGKDFIHPIIKGIILHFLIGYIHPFTDGNGRTARAIFYWFLISKGYWLVEYMSISKIIIRASSQYAKSYLYSEYDNNDLTYFIDYNLKCMDLALKNLQIYIKSKRENKQKLFQIINSIEVNERQADILRSLIMDHIKGFTIKEVQNKFGVVYQTARTDLMKLAEIGYLKEKNIGKKRIYFKSDDFDKKIDAILNKY